MREAGDGSAKALLSFKLVSPWSFGLADGMREDLLEQFNWVRNTNQVSLQLGSCHVFMEYWQWPITPIIRSRAAPWMVVGLPSSSNRVVRHR
jgi:hypothetical protein